jgi:hypothetical protein
MFARDAERSKYTAVFSFKFRSLVSRVRCNPESLHAGFFKNIHLETVHEETQKNGNRIISNAARLNKAEVKVEKVVDGSISKSARPLRAC